MRLKRYIQGERKGKEANRLEREAMQDPFLHDALEGYEGLSGDEATRRIEAMQQTISRRGGRRLHLRYGSIAAAVLLCIGLGTWFLLQPLRTDEQRIVAMTDTMAEEEVMPIAPLPETEELVEEKESLQQEIADQSKAMQLDVIAQDSAPVATEELIESVAPALAMEELIIVEEEEDIVAEEEEVTVTMQQARSIDSRSTVRSAKQMAASVNSNLVIENREVPADSIQLFSEGPLPLHGKEGYIQYISEAIKVIMQQGDHEATGELIISFLIDEKGHPQQLYIEQSLSPSIDEEVMRVIREGDDWEAKKGRVTLILLF